MNILKFYSRKEIQREIVLLAKNREVGVKYGDVGFGKRPDILQFEGDVSELAKNGATSFHVSEERWKDPLSLRTGMTKRELDNLRIGWDFLIDIDSRFLEFSKIAAYLIVEAIKFHNVKNIFVKFSGGTGVHIALPFEAFPEKVNSVLIKDLFPEGPKIIADYLKNMIREPLSSMILEKTDLGEIASGVNKKIPELIENEKFNPYSILGIDTILISSRHMFRSVYSFNEKTNLISIPIKPNNILNFRLKNAKPENVDTGIDFLNEFEEGEASQLIMQAFDSVKKDKKVVVEKEYGKVKVDNEKYFPPCIKLLSSGVKYDGRKRALFILVNYLKSIIWDFNKIENFIAEWNKKNYEMLRDNYIAAQLNWFKRQSKAILPPNCDNKDYYKSINVCKPDNLCRLIKNPVNYSIRKSRLRG